MTDNYLQLKHMPNNTADSIIDRERLVGTANHIRDHKNQFITFRESLSSNTLFIGCRANGTLVVAQTNVPSEYRAIKGTINEKILVTTFSLENGAQDILDLFKPPGGTLVRPEQRLAKNPKKLSFPVEGDVSVLDAVCASPSVQTVLHKPSKKIE